MKKVNKNYIFILIGIVIFTGAIFLIGQLNFSKNSSPINATSAQFKTIDSEEFNDIAKEENAFLLDVHTPEQVHIPGTDAFISYLEIEENQDKLPKDKNTPILVYCRSGSMSKTASETLVNLGYKNVYDLSGGTDLYKKSNQIVDISPKTTDLGTVIYGEVPTTAFTLTNYTSNSLEINRVSTSCECTSAEVEKNTLSPYESIEVNVSFNPAVHGDDTDTGELTRTIYIDTDNSEYSQITANITANVIKN